MREEDARDSDGGKGRKGSSKERSKEKGERERRSEKEKERNSEKFKEKKDEPDEVCFVKSLIHHMVRLIYEIVPLIEAYNLYMIKIK